MSLDRKTAIPPDVQQYSLLQSVDRRTSGVRSQTPGRWRLRPRGFRKRHSQHARNCDREQRQSHDRNPRPHLACKPDAGGEFHVPRRPGTDAPSRYRPSVPETRRAKTVRRGKVRNDPREPHAVARTDSGQEGAPAAGEGGSGGRRRDPEFSRGTARPGDGHDEGSRLSALGSRLSALGSRLSALGSRLSALGSRLSALGSRLSALGSRLSALGSRLSALGSRLSALGSRLSALGSRLSWAAHTSTVVRPSRGQTQGFAARFPAPAAQAGWRFARPPPSRAGAIAAAAQIACNTTQTCVKWV